MGDNKFAIKEKVQIIKWFYSGCSRKEIVQNLFPGTFPDSEVPCERTITNILNRFEKTGSVLPLKRHL